jgi:hypothetical protein
MTVRRTHQRMTEGDRAASFGVHQVEVPLGMLIPRLPNNPLKA